MAASIHSINEAHDNEHDQDLERRVRIYLANQSRSAIRAVEVAAAKGVVTLRGRVHSFYEKQLSIHLAARVAGVRRLEDELIVVT
jgi:osmotically-inducible protein OsmY